MVTSNSFSAASSRVAVWSLRSRSSAVSVPRTTSRRTSSSQLGEGLLEYVGPLVETHVQEKPLSIAMREINEGVLTCTDIDPEAEAEAAAAEKSA